MFSEKCTMIKTKVKKNYRKCAKESGGAKCTYGENARKTIRKYQDNTQNVKNALAILWL